MFCLQNFCGLISSKFSHSFKSLLRSFLFQPVCCNLFWVLKLWYDINIWSKFAFILQVTVLLKHLLFITVGWVFWTLPHSMIAIDSILVLLKLWCWKYLVSFKNFAGFKVKPKHCNVHEQCRLQTKIFMDLWKTAGLREKTINFFMQKSPLIDRQTSQCYFSKYFP